MPRLGLPASYCCCIADQAVAGQQPRLRLGSRPVRLGRNASWRGAAGITLVQIALFIMFATGAAAPASAGSIEDAFPSVVAVLPDWPARRLAPPPSRKEKLRRRKEPEGSGVVWSSGRHIVTAYHVIAKARDVRVRTGSGLILRARITALDAATDLGVLEIETSLPPMPLLPRGGPAPRLGAKACVIGNAFGLGISLSCGIVSGLNRTGVGFNPIEDFVQTDAAANPGVSGGALVDQEGRLIGVLTGIFTKRSDANIGVNFAASLALVERVVSDLIAHGRVRRAPSGLRLRQALGRKAVGQMAALVVAVAKDSPASAAGLRVGDKIIFAGGRRIKTPADFVSVRAIVPLPGALSLVINRNNKNITLTLDIGASMAQ